MKNLIQCSFVILVAATMSQAAFAHQKKGNPACKAIYKACKDAGKKGKEMRSCIKTIKGGGTVDGVTVNPSDVQACQGGGAPQGSTGANGQ